MLATTSSWANRTSSILQRTLGFLILSYTSSVHGSAPDIAGQGVANPLASIRSASLMLRHLGYSKGADRLDSAVDQVIREGKTLTRDLNGTSSTSEVTDAVLKRI